MKFTKYHGTGNDFLLLDEEDVEGVDLSELARTMCHRNFGIGADGLMVAAKSHHGDMGMVYYNQDGTVAPMCGNGLRCFSRFIHENRLVEKDSFLVETLAGVLPVDVSEGYEKIRIGLGKPEHHLHLPHVREELFGDFPIKIRVNGNPYVMYVLFLGTLHGVIFTEKEVSLEDAHGLCHHEFFPKNINVNFTRVLDRENLSVRTFERGVGFTLACGTGVCSAQVTSRRLGYTEDKVRIETPGGALWVEDQGEVYLTGPAVFIAKGEMEIG